MLDSLTGNGGYQPFTTSDLNGGQFTSAASTVSFPNGVKYRHGAIMPITHDEYKSLVKKYGIKR